MFTRRIQSFVTKRCKIPDASFRAELRGADKFPMKLVPTGMGHFWVISTIENDEKFTIDLCGGSDGHAYESNMKLYKTTVGETYPTEAEAIRAVMKKVGK